MRRVDFCKGLVITAVSAITPWPALAQTDAAAPVMGMAAMVDSAARLRMLAQRSAKAYLMLGQDIATEQARVILQTSMEQFELHVMRLKTLSPTGKAIALARLEATWVPCKALLAVAPSRAGADALYDASETVQQAAHRLTLAVEQASDAPINHLISIAGRQRMLSQRMAKFYFFRTWGLYESPADMELHLSRAHFTAVLTQIERSSLATTIIKDSVARIRLEWEPYQELLFASHDPGKMRQDAARVAQGSERVLDVTEELLTRLVELAQSAPAAPQTSVSHRSTPVYGASPHGAAG